MTLEEIFKLAPDEAYKKLQEKEESEVSSEEIANQYDPNKHDVMDAVKRPMKTVKKPSGKDAKGEVTYTDKLEEVNRIAIPLQKLIVERAVGFLLGNPVWIQAGTQDAKAKELLAMVEQLWDDNKLDSVNREIARTLFSECEVAELWFQVIDEEYWDKPNIKIRPKIKVLKPSEGNKLFPYYDEFGDMVAFSREYTIKRDSKSVTKMDTYTKDTIYHFEKNDSGVVLTNEKNLAGKIPIIYYTQPYPEWYLVQTMIDRLESLISNFGDTNDYFGSPMIAITGKVNGFAEKGQQGKMITIGENGKAEYLSWDHAPESVKLEIETLKELIHTCTQTPDISFAQMKGLGNLSGIALKLMFLDAHLKVENKVELFGEMFQRRLNLMKAMCGNMVDISYKDTEKILRLKPVFKAYLPRNEKEEMEMLMTGTGGKAVMSQETAVENNPLVNDTEAEMGRLKKDTGLQNTANAFEPTI
jgi:SPP1 family phage portal protein